MIQYHNLKRVMNFIIRIASTVTNINCPLPSAAAQVFWKQFLLDMIHRKVVNKGTFSVPNNGVTFFSSISKNFFLCPVL